MRILSISAQKPNSTGSGVYLSELVKAYDKAGHKQAVVAGVAKGEKVEFPESVAFFPVEFETESLPFPVAGMSDVMPYASTRYCDFTTEMTKQFCEAFLSTIREAMRHFRPELVICHHLYLVTALASELRSVLPKETRIVAICHSTCLRQYQKNNLEKKRIYDGIRALDRIYALHCGQRAEISRLFQIAEEEIAIIGAGFNEERFFPKKRNVGTAYELCFAGKVSQAKGVESLLRALEDVKANRPMVLHLAGGNGDEKEMERIRVQAAKLSESKKIQVILEGKLPQQELAELYRRCDLFVLPSFYEGLPLVLLEAMGCGCLAIGADWPGVRDWICEKVPAASFLTVSLPGMENPGVPIEAELPDYEERLKRAIEKQLDQIENGVKQADVSALTWKNVADDIVVKECRI